MAQTGPDSGHRLPRRRRPRWNEDAIVLIASGATVTAVAQETGVPRRTLTRWLADGDFQERVKKARSEMFDQPVGVLGAYAALAANVLGSLTTSASSDTVRLAAARAVLVIGRSMRESSEFESRLRALEKKNAGDET